MVAGKISNLVRCIVYKESARFYFAFFGNRLQGLILKKSHGVR